MNRDPSCIFCKIIAGEIPSRKAYEDDELLAFTTSPPGRRCTC
jgi:histidine triad (HIT) family protein